MSGMESSMVGFVLLFFPSGCLRGQPKNFQSAIFEAWQLKISAQFADRKGLR